jgi:tetratricopeptide (TPR) repeat protein
MRRGSLLGRLVAAFSVLIAPPAGLRGAVPEDAPPEAPRELSPAELEALAAVQKRLGAAVVMVGHPGGGHGTAFVISRRQRLLATAAHVADHLNEAGATMLAIPSGVAVTYRVERAWYHPNVARELDEGLIVRSDDPGDGKVHPSGPDVAVLRLAAEGPDLPAEFALAGDDELRDLAGRAVGRLGFPFDANPNWPGPSRPPAAKLAAGTVTRLTDFALNLDAPPERRQQVEYSARGLGGESGGPIFLPDGRVAAIAVGTYVARPRGSKSVHFGIRVDALRELLAYHKLGDAPAVPIPSDWGPDPHLNDYRKAVRLVRAARKETTRKEYKGAGERCNEAIRLAPRYGLAYLQRGQVYLDYLSARWKSLPDPERLRLAGWVVEDAGRCIERDRYKAEAYLVWMQGTLYRARLRPDPDACESCIACADSMLDPDHVTDFNESQRSYATACRAQARHLLGDLDGALKDYDAAIRLAPDEPCWYLLRAQTHDRAGHPDLAARDRAKAEGLRLAGHR